MGTPLRMGLVVAVLVGGVVACNNDTDVTTLPEALTIVAGNAQTDTAGATLADTLKVQVTNRTTLTPVSGRVVSWAVVSGGGSVNPTSSTTNANGIATTVWTLGTTLGTQMVTASVPSRPGIPADTFTATATASVTHH
jgi:hypothetical protein